MTDAVLAIIAFALFSLITDFIEGKKKKRKQEESPSEGGWVEMKRPKDKEIVIPPIQHIPQKYERPNVYGTGKVNPLPTTATHRYNTPQEAAVVVDSNYDEAKPLKAADIHWNVLLNAVAYTQILQPPKAYQYMATKSCRGEWNNEK